MLPLLLLLPFLFNVHGQGAPNAPKYSYYGQALIELDKLNRTGIDGAKDISDSLRDELTKFSKVVGIQRIGDGRFDDNYPAKDGEFSPFVERVYPLIKSAVERNVTLTPEYFEEQSTLKKVHAVSVDLSLSLYKRRKIMKSILARSFIFKKYETYVNNVVIERTECILKDEDFFKRRYPSDSSEVLAKYYEFQLNPLFIHLSLENREPLLERVLVDFDTEFPHVAKQKRE